MLFSPMSFPYALRNRTLLLVLVIGPWCAQLHAVCTLNPSSPSVTICEPVNGATVPTPVHIVAGTTDTNPVTLVQIYVDGLKKYEVKANSLDTSLAMPLGARRVTVQAKDSVGTIFKSTVNITVTNTANGATQVLTTGERGNYRAVALHGRLIVDTRHSVPDIAGRQAPLVRL